MRKVKTGNMKYGLLIWNKDLSFKKCTAFRWHSLEIIAVIAKHEQRTTAYCAITTFFDTYLFLLLLEISQHCF